MRERAVCNRTCCFLPVQFCKEDSLLSIVQMYRLEHRTIVGRSSYWWVPVPINHWFSTFIWRKSMTCYLFYSDIKIKHFESGGFVIWTRPCWIAAYPSLSVIGMLFWCNVYVRYVRSMFAYTLVPFGPDAWSHRSYLVANFLEI